MDFNNNGTSHTKVRKLDASVLEQKVIFFFLLNFFLFILIFIIIIIFFDFYKFDEIKNDNKTSDIVISWSAVEF